MSTDYQSLLLSSLEYIGDLGYRGAKDYMSQGVTILAHTFSNWVKLLLNLIFHRSLDSKYFATFFAAIKFPSGVQ